MRVKFVVLALFMGCLALLLGPSQGLTQFQGGGGWGNRGGGFGGGGGMARDPGQIFDWSSQGQPTSTIAKQRWGREDMEAWAQKQGITNGQLTKEQYISYSQSPEAQQARERMRQQWGGGGGGGRGLGGGNTPAAPGT